MNLQDAIAEISKHLDNKRIDNILLSDVIIITDTHNTKITLSLSDDKFHIIGDLYKPQWLSCCCDYYESIKIYRYNNYFEHISDIIDELDNPTKYKNIHEHVNDSRILVANCF